MSDLRLRFIAQRMSNYLYNISNLQNPLFSQKDLIYIRNLVKEWDEAKKEHEKDFTRNIQLSSSATTDSHT